MSDQAPGHFDDNAPASPVFHAYRGEKQGRRLESWKEIASFLGRDPRTVQRWEKTLSLPVHRQLTSKAGYVYAFTDELDLWRERRSRLSGVEQANEQQPTPVQPSETPRASITSDYRRLVYIGVAVFGLCVVFGVRQWIRTPSQSSRFTPIPFTSLPGDEFSPSFSPDGKMVVFSSGSPDLTQFSLLIKDVDGGTERRISSGYSLEYSPVWSPDLKRIAFLRGPFLRHGEVWMISPDGRSSQKVAATRLTVWPGPRQLAWMPDGKGLIVPDTVQGDTSLGLFLIALAGGSRRQVTFPRAYCVDSSPVISLDSTSLIFARACRGASALYRQSLKNPAEIEHIALPDLKDPASIAICRPAGEKDLVVAVVHSDVSELWRVPPAGSASLIATVERSVQDIAASARSNSIVYAVDITDENLWALRISGAAADGAPRRLDDLMSTRNEYNAQFSPDGKRLVFESDRTGYPEVWISDLNGSNARALTHFQGPVTGSPRWSFDGKLITFDSRVNGHAAIFVMTPEGRSMRRVTGDDGPNVVPSFSHDGKWIYFGSGRSGSSQIWKIHSDGRDATQITQEGGFAAQETPDGRFLYYTKNRDAITSLWRVPVNGGVETPVVDSVVERSFVVADKGVYFATASDPRLSAVIKVIGFGKSKPAVVAPISHAPVYALTIAPDQKELVWGQRDASGTDLVIAKHFVF